MAAKTEIEAPVVRASARYVRIAPRKVRVVIDWLRQNLKFAGHSK